MGVSFSMMIKPWTDPVIRLLKDLLNGGNIPSML